MIICDNTPATMLEQKIRNICSLFREAINEFHISVIRTCFLLGLLYKHRCQYLSQLMVFFFQIFETIPCPNL